MASQILSRTMSPAQTYRSPQASAYSQEDNQPPAKRQKISPVDSPELSHSPRLTEMPNSAQFDMRPNGLDGNQSPHNEELSQTQRSTGMGPPQRPIRQTQDTAREPDFQQSTDVLTGIVNIEEEEQALRNNGRKTNQASQRAYGSQNTELSLSHPDFLSDISSDPARQSLQSGPRFERHREVVAERVEAAFLSDHLNRPFIRAGTGFSRVRSRAQQCHLRAPTPRRKESISPVTAPASLAGTLSQVGPDPSYALVAKNESVANSLATISLAAKEKLRGLLEAVKTVATARQQGSDGNVPEDFVDIAVATDGSGAGPSRTTKTPSFNNHLVTKLRKRLDGTTSTDAKRKEKRAHRLAKALVADPTGATPTSVDVPSAPGSGAVTPGLVAPDPKAAPSLKRKANEKLSQREENAARITANRTASHMMGKKPKYSWMSQGGAATPKAFVGSSASRNGGSSSTRHDTAEAQAKKRKFGDLREDGPEGANILLRDWIAVLETDSREQKTLVKAIGSMK